MILLITFISSEDDRYAPLVGLRSLGANSPRKACKPNIIELCRIVDIELEMVQARIQNAAADKPFGLNVTDGAREFLLTEGTDSRYGARHLKRAIERLIVYPLSNLIASGQIQRGDRIRVSHSEGSPTLMFFNEAPPAIASSQVAGRIAA